MGGEWWRGEVRFFADAQNDMGSAVPFSVMVVDPVPTGSAQWHTGAP